MFLSYIKHARALLAVVFAAASIPALATVPVQAQSAQRMCIANSGAHIVMIHAPDYPTIARIQGATGTAIVQVDLSASGDLSTASILKSSGNRFLDDAALRAVRDSRFAPEVTDCATVGGSYLVEVNWE